MEKLKNLRRQKGLTQEQLARLSGISRVAVSKLETGATSTPTVRTIRQLAAALNVAPSYFF